MQSVLCYGAIPDGKTDCLVAIQNALKKEKEIYFPSGVYLITGEILIPSNRKIVLESDAEIYCADNCFNKSGVRAMITNDDYINGNENIYIEGGKFNGNNKNNRREDWAKGPNQGLMFSFYNVRNLTIKNANLYNPESYHIRLGKTTDFLIENINITTDFLTPCQDGVHVGGYSHRGVIKNITAVDGATNDDLIAFNADDANWYCQNWGMEDGSITDMVVDGVYAKNCWTGCRILSVKSLVKNILVKNMEVGVREMGINFDATRYCADKIFDEKDYPNGVGNLDNVVFENIKMWRTRELERTILLLESNGNYEIKNFKRKRELEPQTTSKTAKTAYLYGSKLTINKKEIALNGEETFYDGDSYDIKVEKI